MALSFRTSTQNSSSTGTAISVSAPTGTTTGDLVKVVVHGNGQTTIADNNTSMALDATSSKEQDASNTATWSHTCTGSNLVLGVVTANYDSGGDTDGVVTGVTYNGVALTKASDAVYAGLGMTCSAWYLIGPATGANNIVVTCAGTTDNIKAAAASYSNAKLASQPNANVSSTTTSGKVRNNTFTTTANNCFRLDIFQSYDSTWASVGAGQTTIFTSGGGYVKATYSGPITPAASDTDSATSNAAVNDRMIGSGLAFAPANAAFTEQIDDYKPNTSSGHTMSVFSRVIEAGDPTTYNFTLGASGRWAAVAICATDSSTPTDDVAPSTTNAGNRDSAGDGNATTASITTGVDNAAHIIVAGWDTGAIGTITTPSGYTLLANANGGGQPTHVAYKVITPAGATGTTTPTNTEFAAYITFSFSIKGVAVATTIKTLAALGVG